MALNAIIPVIFLNPFVEYDGTCCHCILKEMSEHYALFSRNIKVGEQIMSRVFVCSKVEWMLGCHLYDNKDTNGRGWEIFLRVEYPEYFITHNLN